MNDDQILASPEVRMINILIDENAADLILIEKRLQASAREYGESTKRLRAVGTRIHEEDPLNHSGSNIDLVDTYPLDRIPDLIRERDQLIDRINYLQRAKLRLLNDYDFTRGDDSFQKAVFGDLNAQD